MTELGVSPCASPQARRSLPKICRFWCIWGKQQARSSVSSLITPARGGCQHGVVVVSQLAAEVLKGPAAPVQPRGFLLFLVFYSRVSVWSPISTEALSL